MTQLHYLIIGNGAAGVTAAETIRAHDLNGRITIVTAEPYPMYSRPGLAYVILQEIPPEQIMARQPQWYAQQRIELVYGRATSLNVQQQSVALENGRILHYDRLLIATGARAVPPPYAGADLDGVVYLDTLDGTKHLLKKARRAKRAVVIGGGITAMELAEGLAHQGVDTHYFLRRDRLWSQVFNETEAALVADKMRHHGITIHLHTEAAEILGDRRGRVRGVRLQNGDEFRCDLVGVAIGVRPQLELVEATPIQTDRAILVDETLRSSAPNVFAAGDCAQVYDRWSAKYMVDILWPSAIAEGRTAALNMVGKETLYRKGTPFNACLLFGLHITVIGQINPRPDEVDNVAVVQKRPLSRGASEVWFTFPRTYQSAWSGSGPNTLRLVIGDNHIVGALIIGEQSLADTLRDLIEREVNATPLLPYLQADPQTLRQKILALGQRQEGI
ncbi:MAG: NAD(P)/FAD-dependent oxidoreductase [Ardenticatenaceae bacterium]|nr:NAD(P)/FAD-dependent oxidoreductase [Ardenticatenaceae bacterium]